ncbi:MAG: 3-dehydroquinate synthase [Vicinamibacterales bacterium]
MDVIQQNVRVAFDYPVYFTTGVFAPENPVLREVLTRTDDPLPVDMLVVVDSGVAAAHPTLMQDIERYHRACRDIVHLAGPILTVPGGEQSKNEPRVLTLVQDAIHVAALCRHSFVMAVGGGAVLDVVGYAAAIAHRGIRLIRVPTTVLAQDDSAVGVKNGVNAFGKKNYLGTFAAPFAVIDDFAFLTTLDDRDWLGGVSEAVKAALIKDAAFFDDLEQQVGRLVARDAEVMQQVVRRSAALHLSHIATGGDPFELGSSRPLDFGHWAAHRLEHLTSHRLRHGEAVAIGVALDSTYSCLSGFLPEADWRRIVDLLLALRLPLYTDELGAHLDVTDHPWSVLRGLAEFREHLGGQLTIRLLHGIGRAFDVHDIDLAVMIRSIEILKRVHEGGSAAAAAGHLLVATPSRGPS